MPERVIVEVRDTVRGRLLTIAWAAFGIGGSCAIMALPGWWQGALTEPWGLAVWWGVLWVGLIVALARFALALRRWRSSAVSLRATSDGLWFGSYPEFGVVPWSDVLNLRGGVHWRALRVYLVVDLHDAGAYWRKLPPVWRLIPALTGFGWLTRFLVLSLNTPDVAEPDRLLPSLEEAWRRYAGRPAP